MEDTASKSLYPENKSYDDLASYFKRVKDYLTKPTYYEMNCHCGSGLWTINKLRTRVWVTCKNCGYKFKVAKHKWNTIKVKTY